MIVCDFLCEMAMIATNNSVYACMRACLVRTRSDNRIISNRQRRITRNRNKERLSHYGVSLVLIVLSFVKKTMLSPSNLEELAMYYVCGRWHSVLSCNYVAISVICIFELENRECFIGNFEIKAYSPQVIGTSFLRHKLNKRKHIWQSK